MFIKKVRLGKDAVMGTTASGQPVLNVTAAYDIGYGQSKSTQWIGLSKWGDSAAKFAPYLTKGKEIVVYVDDVRVEDYNGKGYLKGNIVKFDFVSGQREESQQQPAQQSQGYQQSGYQQQPAQQPQQQPQQAQSGGYDFDDNIPF